MTQIVKYGNTDIEQVKDLEKRICDFLPGAKDVPANVRMAMAQIAISHGLDPWLKELWPIPVWKDGHIVGYELMIGISGWRSSAHRTEEYWGRRFEKVTDEERKMIGAGPNDLVAHCFVLRRKTGHQPMEFDGYGMASPSEKSKMNKFQLARLRAERDAMKAAFPIDAPVGVTVKISDETSGEVINGDHGPDLPSLSRYDSSKTTGEIIDPEEVLKENKQALGRDDGDLTGAYTPVVVTDEQAAQAAAEFPEAATKFEGAPGEPVDATFQVAFEGLGLSKPRQEAMLKRFKGDYKAAYEFATKTA